ncbi:hypothetical protein Tco_1065250 [Tanacetum coccineum]
MCCDDAYRVTPHVFALTGCDKLVSKPLVIEKMKQTAYKRRAPIVTSVVQVKEKSPKRVPDVESEEDPEEDPQEDSEKEGEPKKKQLKEA